MQLAHPSDLERGTSTSRPTDESILNFEQNEMLEHNPNLKMNLITSNKNSDDNSHLPRPIDQHFSTPTIDNDFTSKIENTISPIENTKKIAEADWNMDWQIVKDWQARQNSPKIEDAIEASVVAKESVEKDLDELFAFDIANSKTHPKKPKQTPIDHRITVSAFVSPTSMNSFVGNSMLSDEMKDFKTENNVTISYGLKGAFAVSPKIKVRTGISVVGFEQITRNVPLIQNDLPNSTASKQIKANNINYKNNILIGYVKSQPGMNPVLNRPSQGNMEQTTQYIEIPLEAEIAIFETSSIGISATGGGSTWLLSKNKIYVHNEGMAEELGTANNLNKTSFSANAGLKFDLKLTDDVKLNVEPHFKYLINTVNNIEKFNPYVIGVNAGVSIDLK